MNQLKARTLIVDFLRTEFNWGEGHIKTWLNSTNRNFKQKTPESLIQRGQGEQILHLFARVKQRKDAKLRKNLTLKK